MGEKLFILRRNLGLSQFKLAKMCGVTQQFIQSIEKGKRMPSLRIASRIATALNVSIDDLLEEVTEHAS